jgi:DNA-binding XRE family transcriptional regulator
MAVKKEIPKDGRPSKYNKDYTPKLAEAYAMTGLTDKEIASKLGITESTIHKWKLDHPEFSESLKKGKSNPDDVVEASLYKRAIGYENPNAVKIFMPAGSEKPVYAPYTEYYPPDVMAIIYWLNNRRPDRWRKNQDKDNTTKDDTISRLLLIAEKLTGTNADK